jgi:hypothetical protein
MATCPYHMCHVGWWHHAHVLAHVACMVHCSWVLEAHVLVEHGFLHLGIRVHLHGWRCTMGRGTHHSLDTACVGTLKHQIIQQTSPGRCPDQTYKFRSAHHHGGPPVQVCSRIIKHMLCTVPMLTETSGAQNAFVFAGMHSLEVRALKLHPRGPSHKYLLEVNT